MASSKQRTSTATDSQNGLQSQPKTGSETVGGGRDTGELDREMIFEVLSNERRRLVLHYFEDHSEEEIMLRELVDQVAAWENDTTIENLDSVDRKCVYTALKQSHLPKLDDFGVVEYDHLRGSVKLDDGAAEVRPYLEYVPQDDISWSRYYLGLSAISAVLAGLVWAGVPLFGGLGGFTLLGIVVLMFVCSSAVHCHRSKQARLERPIDERGSES